MKTLEERIIGIIDVLQEDIRTREKAVRKGETRESLERLEAIGDGIEQAHEAIKPIITAYQTIVRQRIAAMRDRSYELEAEADGKDRHLEVTHFATRARAFEEVIVALDALEEFPIDPAPSIHTKASVGEDHED